MRTPVTIVGRQKKAAKRVNYKISFDLLARLKAISVIEDRSDTAQLERYIREGSDLWEQQNPEQSEHFNELVEQFLNDLGGGDEE